MAHRLGIESELPEVCSITLGSVQVNPLEMANAYSTLASQGVYHRANPLHEVDRPNGQPADRRVASPERDKLGAVQRLQMDRRTSRTR